MTRSSHAGKQPDRNCASSPGRKRLRFLYRELRDTRHKGITLFFAFAGSLVLVTSAVIQIVSFAVYHDELWNHPAALSLLAGKSWQRRWEIHLLGVHLPLVSGPYQGSLKSYLLAPLLAIFGTSPAALRGIHCLFGLAYLVGLYWALKPAITSRIAGLVFLLPLVDPNLTSFVPTDQGPFLLQNVLLALAFGCFLRLHLLQAPVWLFTGLALTSLALADKLTGAPVVAPLYLFLLFWAARNKLPSVKGVLLIITAGLTPLLPHAIYFWREGFDELRGNVGGDISAGWQVSYPERFTKTVSDLVNNFGSGPHMPLAITGVAPPKTFPLLVVLGVIVIALGTLLAIRDNERKGRTSLWACLWFVLALLSFAAVPGLHRPWHYLALHPPLVTATFLSGYTVFSYHASTARRFLQAAFLPLLVVAAGLGVKQTHNVLRHFAMHPAIYIASPGLYQLYFTLTQMDIRQVVCLNYSLCNPLFVLFGGRVDVVDFTWAPLSEQTRVRFESLLSQPRSVGVYRTIAKPFHPWEEAHVQWLNRVSNWLLPQLAQHKKLHPTTVFSDGHATFGLVATSGP